MSICDKCNHHNVCGYQDDATLSCNHFQKEVVRCKDCKHGIWDDEEAMWKCVYDAEFDEQYGEYFGFSEYNDGEHFCSYGERKDNG